MLHEPFYDPLKSYEANLAEGPFGAFADGNIYQDEGEPKENFLGHKVYVPFGIAPGPLINGQFVKAALDKGFDIVTYKTVRSRPHPCHPWPNVVPVAVEGNLTLEKAAKGLVSKADFVDPIAITNSFGVPSLSPDEWQPDVAACVHYAGNGQVVVGGFQGTPDGSGREEQLIEDYVQVAKLLVEAGVKIVEANLSCPNEGTSHLLCFDVPRVQKIAAAVKEAIGNIPLILKTAYFADNNLLEHILTEVGAIADAFAMINTIAAPVVTTDGSQALPGPGRLKSGVCGAPIKWAGLEMVGRAREIRAKHNLKFTIIGIGGVTRPSDYTEYRSVGADAVECATGAMWNPYLAQEIKKDLKNKKAALQLSVRGSRFKGHYATRLC